MATEPLVEHRDRTPTRTRGLLAVGAGAAALALTGCTAHMQMRLDAAGTYDAELVMRDTTGTIFTADTDCQDYAAQSLVGAGDGVKVTASPVGSADDAEGIGCEVHVTGVPIPDAGDTEEVTAGESASEPLVVRNGDLYVVHVTGYGGAPTDTPGGTGGTDGAQDSAGASPAAPDAGATAAQESLNTAVDARLSITFPGAVVDAGGGRVSGNTVTWEDADLLYDGVTASGRATDGDGLSPWDRYGWWIVAGVGAAGAAVGAVVLRRRRRRSAH
ncbi:hypothetical protein [Actinomyces sp.]|uniref:LppM family (lipo)protein n=1 Tax=Actinomyces sp. TaxID=29317 RepID=UPI0026DCA9DE|nr:hypothetical protein [Actinomyces sp.]MDO4900931.1 hypothetical protein [Actinomyces sp.]